MLKYRQTLLVIAAVGLLASGASTETQEATTRVIVTAEAEAASLTSPSVEQAAEQKNEIPGGFSLRTPEEMDRGRASNFEDLLQRTPGLYMQTDNGVEGAVNIDRSYHQGIEAGLGIELLDAVFLPKQKGNSRDRLTLSQTYTLNDFHFDVIRSTATIGLPACRFISMRRNCFI